MEQLTYDPKKLNAPKIGEFVALVEEVSDKLEAMEEGNSRYENAEELTGEEAADEREIARDEVWEAATEIVEEGEKLLALMKSAI